MSELVVILPPRWQPTLDDELDIFLYDNKTLQQEDVLSVGEFPQATSLTLLLDPSDCTLLRLTVPPISGGRLKLALPNLVEDHVLGDVDDQHIALGAADAEQKRWIAMVHREWLISVLRFFADQHKKIKQVLPLSMRLPTQPESWTIWRGRYGACLCTDSEILSLPYDSQEFQTALMLAQSQLLLPKQIFLFDKAPVLTIDATYTHVEADWLTPSAAEFNLLQFDLLNASNIKTESNPEWHFTKWRLALSVMGFGVLLWIIGLHIYQHQLSSEIDQIKQSMRSQYQTLFPGAQVADPLLQITQKQKEYSAIAGEFVMSDFMMMMDAIAKVISTEHAQHIQDISYQKDQIKLKFKAEFKLADADKTQWSQRFQQQGLQLTQPSADQLIIMVQGR